MLHAQLTEHFVAGGIVRNRRPKFFLRQSDLVLHAFAIQNEEAALLLVVAIAALISGVSQEKT